MKQIIWSNDSFMDDEAREYYQDCQREYLEDDGYTVSDEEWGEEVYRWLDDERMNLNVQVDGVIIAFGDLGLWRGRRQGYQILGSNVADILHSSCDDNEWYGDGYNIRGRMAHHDVALSLRGRHLRLESQRPQTGVRAKSKKGQPFYRCGKAVVLLFDNWQAMACVTFYTYLTVINRLQLDYSTPKITLSLVASSLSFCGFCFANLTRLTSFHFTDG